MRRGVPEGATIFGKRRDLIEEAKKRIYQKPDRYYPHIYGEHEVGGTAVHVPFRGPLREARFPETTWERRRIPSSPRGSWVRVPLVDILWPAVLFGFNYLVTGKEGHEDTKESGHGK